ncbi:MAG: hypothetical protein ABJR05_11795 [Balneola sp.]
MYKLESNGTSLFAGTDSGFYQLNLGSETSMRAIFYDSATVRTFSILDENSWLLAADFENQDLDNLYKTDDAGTNWQPYRNGYGGNNDWTPTTMDASIEGSDTLIAARTSPFGTVGLSRDGGRSWDSSWESWDNPTLATSSFVNIEQNDPEIIIAGGSTAIFTPIFLISYDRGENWDIHSIIENSEATVMDGIVNIESKDEVIVGANLAAILKSENRGESWETIQSGNIINSFTRSSRDGNIIYASGIIQNGKEVLYFGTNKGLYSFTLEN